ncbi:MAG: TIR domain-containing protein [Xanthobacteraceae bacterium]
MPAIFISHSSLDQNISDDIKASLAKLGFEQVFLDFDKDSGIGAGENWERRLYEELARCHAVILVLTPNWLASTWCRIELAQARALGKVILPVLCAPLGERFVLPEVQAVDLVDWNAGGLERLDQRLNAITSELARGFRLHPDRSPYPGIHAFEAEDAAIYFGRDDETRAVIERLDARRTQGGARLLVIIGASGSGKSSLLRAGVLPQIARRRREWIPLPPIRPEKAPLETIAKAIATHVGKPQEWRSWHQRLGKPEAVNDVDELVKDLRIGESTNATVLLPIDQFEEVFTVATAEERNAFLRLVCAVLDPARDIPLLVVATGRSDVLEGLIATGDLGQLTETFPLPLMPLERVPRLVEGPATVASINVEKGLPERIARDVENAEALPLLAHTLWLLYRRSGGDNKLTIAEYEALGDAQRGLNPVQNSVRLVADQAIAGLRPSPRELAALRDAFVPHLVRIRLEDGKRVRQAARLSELPPDAHRLVQALVAARLLTIRGDRDGAEQQQLVEVTHEALFKAWPDLDQWLLEEQAFLTDLERIRGSREVWMQAPQEQKPNALLRGLLLTRSRDWLLRYPQRFTGRDMEPLRAFVAESAAAEDAERTRAQQQEARTRRMERMLFRGAIAASVIMAILAVGAGVAAFMAIRSEERAARNFERTVDQSDELISKISDELRDRVGISQDVIRRILSLIESQMDELVRSDQRSPRLAISRANMLSAFAENYIELGDLEKAKQRALECADIVRPLQRAAENRTAVTQQLADCLEVLANALAARSLFKDSIKAYQESIALRRQLLAADPTSTTRQRELGHILTYYAYAEMVSENLAEALARAEETVAITKALAERDNQNAEWTREYVDSLNTYALVMLSKRDLAASIKAFTEAIRISQDLITKDEGNATMRRFLSNILANASDVLFELNENDKALTLLDRSVNLKRRLHTADALNATWEFELSLALVKLGRSQFTLKKFDDAFVSFNEARDRMRTLLNRDPANALRRWMLIDCLMTMALASREKGDPKAARDYATQGIAVIDGLVEIDSTDVIVGWIKDMKGKAQAFVAALPAE